MELQTSIIILAILFFFVAFIYSSVGLAGGSSYTALMSIFGLSPMSIPMVSLVLNVFVSTVSSYNFIRHDHARFKIIAPFLVTSIPMAYVGGSLKIAPDVFYWLLFLSLILVAVRIFLFPTMSLRIELGASQK